MVNPFPGQTVHRVTVFFFAVLAQCEAFSLPKKELSSMIEK